MLSCSLFKPIKYKEKIKMFSSKNSNYYNNFSVANCIQLSKKIKIQMLIALIILLNIISINQCFLPKRFSLIF